MLENGKGDLEMAMVSRLGQMELNTLESGERIGLMEKEGSFMLMETSMMDFGLTTKQTELESTCM